MQRIPKRGIKGESPGLKKKYWARNRARKPRARKARKMGKKNNGEKVSDP